MDKNKLIAEDFEINNQKEFDFVELKQFLQNTEDEEGYQNLTIKENRYSLFYPIFKICLNFWNNSSKEVKELNKFIIEVYENNGEK